MGHQGRRTAFAERLEISTRATAGQRDSEDSRSTGSFGQYGAQVATQGTARGTGRISFPSGEAVHGCFGTVLFRDAREDPSDAQSASWAGPLTIRIELEGDSDLVGNKIPSRSRIAAFLHQEDFARPYEHHRDLPQPREGAPQEFARKCLFVGEFFQKLRGVMVKTN